MHSLSNVTVFIIKKAEKETKRNTNVGRRFVSQFFHVVGEAKENQALVFFWGEDEK
jgi:hypothetical protein